METCFDLHYPIYYEDNFIAFDEYQPYSDLNLREIFKPYITFSEYEFIKTAVIGSTQWPIDENLLNKENLSTTQVLLKAENIYEFTGKASAILAQGNITFDRAVFYIQEFLDCTFYIAEVSINNKHWGIHTTIHEHLKLNLPEDYISKFGPNKIYGKLESIYKIHDALEPEFQDIFKLEIIDNFTEGEKFLMIEHQ